MSKSFLDKLIDNIFDEKWLGKYGERLTERELKLVQLFGRKGKTLKNVYLPKENGETSEVDVIFITQKGIFVFESKNYSGWIFGDEKNKNWTVSLPNGQKNQFYNPVMQNRTHMKWMRNFVGEDVPLFSIIVFSERCELKKVTVYSGDVKVIQRDRTYATVRDIWENTPDALSEEKISELYEKLKELTNVDAATKAAHIENIERKYKKGPEEAEAEKDSRTEPLADANIVEEANTVIEESVTETSLICPKCGGKLVLRTAKKGSNAGNQFYGCSNFPKCRYIQK
jgi:predicted RNA-binding Zn-ribbon protein involved in translation (DUF1610 family)